MQQTLHGQQYENATVLYMALELSKRVWKVGFSNGIQPRIRDVKAGDIAGLLSVIAEAKAKLGLPADARVVSGYEAGRDGFWIHRLLVSHGIDNRVMDASSFEVERRARRAKTDRIDVHKLLSLLIREARGERRAYSQVRVPSEAIEARRRLHRERGILLCEQNAVRNRLKGLLALHGFDAVLTRDFGEQLDTLKDWQGRRLDGLWIAEFKRAWQRLQLIAAQLKELAQLQQQRLACGADRAAEQMRALRVLKGLAQQIPWTLVHELFAWRQFRNAREIGALAGLTPTPYASGARRREQGISKHGIARVRTLAVELAWLWVRHQPHSPITRWFEARFARGGKRHRRIGIVAVARKLLIALWRYLKTGVLPEGALVKA